MRGGSTRTIPAFDDIEEQLGYNPARFLHTRSADGFDGPGDTSELALVEAVIRGIDDTETIQAWREVERALGRDGGEPRQRVSNWLEQREEQLQPTASDEEPAPEPANMSEPTPEGDERTTAGSATGEDEETAEPAVEQSPTATPTTTSTTEQTAVATDGGATAIADPTCSECGDDQSVEEICGQVGYFCPTCHDFTDPVEGSA